MFQLQKYLALSVPLLLMVAPRCLQSLISQPPRITIYSIFTRVKAERDRMIEHCASETGAGKKVRDQILVILMRYEILADAWYS